MSVKTSSTRRSQSTSAPAVQIDPQKPMSGWPFSADPSPSRCNAATTSGSSPRRPSASSTRAFSVINLRGIVDPGPNEPVDVPQRDAGTQGNDLVDLVAGDVVSRMEPSAITDHDVHRWLDHARI